VLTSAEWDANLTVDGSRTIGRPHAGVDVIARAVAAL
jgi:hypothetical protein